MSKVNKNFRDNAIRSLSLEVEDEIARSLKEKTKLFSFLSSKDFEYIKNILSIHTNKIIGITLLNIIHASITGIQSLSILIFVKLLLEGKFESSSEFDIIGINIPIPAELIFNDPYGGILLIFTLVLFFSFLSLLLLVYINHLNLTLQNSLTYKMRSDLVNKLFLLDTDFYNDNKIGEIEFLQSQSIRRFGMIVGATQTLMNAIFNTIVVLFILIKMSYSLTIFISILGFVFLFSTHYLSRKVVIYGHKVDSKSLEVSESFFDIMNGIRLVKQAARENVVIGDFLKKVWSYLESSRKLIEYQVIIRGITELGGALLLILITALYSYFSDIDFLADLGFTVGFFFLFSRVIYHVRMMLNARMKQAQALPQLSFFRKFLDYEKNSNEKLKFNGSIKIRNIKKGIELKNIDFKYSDKSIIKNVSVCFPVGKTTAVVGPSGSGKSTLLEILSGYQFPQNGSVLVDDIDLKKYNKGHYRKITGYVNQDTIVFHDTILNNVNFFNKSASMNEIEKRAKEIGVTNIVEDMSNKWNTYVGEKGAKISGGQRQRISLLRVLMQSPSLLILDEATSSLDLISESNIYKTIDNDKYKRVTVIVAHRLSAITHVDNIIVMHNGEVAEQGTHESLLKNGGIYQKMFQIQKKSNVS